MHLQLLQLMRQVHHYTGALARYIKTLLFAQPGPPTSGLPMAHPWAGLTEFLSQLKTTFARSLEAPLPGACLSMVSIHLHSHQPSCSSLVLSDFKPCFNATAVQRLLDNGAIPIGKTVMDEFGMGSFTLNNGAILIDGNPSNTIGLQSRSGKWTAALTCALNDGTAWFVGGTANPLPNLCRHAVFPSTLRLTCQRQQGLRW